MLGSGLVVRCLLELILQLLDLILEATHSFYHWPDHSHIVVGVGIAGGRLRFREIQPGKRAWSARNDE